MVDDYSATSEKKRKPIYDEITKQLEKIINQVKSKTPQPVISIVTFEDMIDCKKIKDLYKFKISP